MIEDLDLNIPNDNSVNKMMKTPNSKNLINNRNSLLIVT